MYCRAYHLSNVNVNEHNPPNETDQSVRAYQKYGTRLTTVKTPTFRIFHIDEGMRAVRWSIRDSYQKNTGKRRRPITSVAIGCARPLGVVRQ